MNADMLVDILCRHDLLSAHAASIFRPYIGSWRRGKLVTRNTIGTRGDVFHYNTLFPRCDLLALKLGEQTAFFLIET